MCVSLCQTLPQQSDSTTKWELRARMSLVSLAVSLNRGFPQTPSESSHQLFLDVQFATWLKWSFFFSLIALTNWDLLPAPTYSAWGFFSLTSIFLRAMSCSAFFFLIPCMAQKFTIISVTGYSHMSLIPHHKSTSLEASAHTLTVFLSYLLCHFFFIQ